MRTLENGLTILGGNIGGASGSDLYTAVFYDGERLRLYVPRCGNTFNADLNCRFGEEWHWPADKTNFDENNGEPVIDRDHEFGELVRRCQYLAPILSKSLKLIRDTDNSNDEYDEKISESELKEKCEAEVTFQIILLYFKEQGMNVDAYTLRAYDYIRFVTADSLMIKDILAGIEVIN